MTVLGILAVVFSICVGVLCWLMGNLQGWKEGFDTAQKLHAEQDQRDFAANDENAKAAWTAIRTELDKQMKGLLNEEVDQS